MKFRIRNALIYLFLLSLSLLNACNGSGQSVRPDSIKITGVNEAIARNMTTQLTALAVYADGSQADITSSVAWDSANESIATVDSSGSLKGLSAGTTLITASYSGVNSELSVSVLAEQLLRGPYLQMATPTSIIVKWRTDLLTGSSVLYGGNTDKMEELSSEHTAVAEHQVLLSGLTPGTKYYYKIGNDSLYFLGGDANYSFITPPLGSKDAITRIWVLGDSGTANFNAAAVKDAYKRYSAGRETDVWLMLGDNAYNDGTDQQYQSAVFDMYPEFLRKTVLWPTFGNHDGHTSNSLAQSGPYYDNFVLPANGEAGGVSSGTEAYYSFDYGDIHFICLNSYDIDRGTAGAMLTWLGADLAANQKKWVIAYWHHPPYSKGTHDSDEEINLIEMRENVLPILESYGADLVLSGHSHNYERSFLMNGHYGFSDSLVPSMVLNNGDGRVDGDGAYVKSGGVANSGTVYIVAGSSGSTNTGSFDHPAMYISMKSLGSLVITVGKSAIHAVFLDNQGMIKDQFTLIK